MCNLLRRMIREDIAFTFHAGESLGRVKADPGQIEQVIMNLAVNAGDAMPAGGSLTIETHNVTVDEQCALARPPILPGLYVLLAVTDTGHGMDVETKARIFEPFFTTKGPGKGTGLGLATVYGIVKQSGGGIDVQSEPGKGSRFVIYFPKQTAPVDAPPLPSSPTVPASGAETVLVVEDEEVVRQLVCTVLSDVGYKVLCAASPSEALRLVREHADKIDLLVTDMVMPEMHGPALAREILSLRPEGKVLFVSGYSESDMSEQGVA